MLSECVLANRECPPSSVSTYEAAHREEDGHCRLLQPAHCTTQQTHTGSLPESSEFRQPPPAYRPLISLAIVPVILGCRILLPFLLLACLGSHPLSFEKHAETKSRDQCPLPAVPSLHRGKSNARFVSWYPLNDVSVVCGASHAAPAPVPSKITTLAPPPRSRQTGAPASVPYPLRQAPDQDSSFSPRVTSGRWPFRCVCRRGNRGRLP